MAVKVRYKKNGKVYVYLGVGFGMYKSMAAGSYLEAWFPQKDEGQKGMVALCNEKGEIRWADHGDLEVIDIDGHSPADLLK